MKRAPLAVVHGTVDHQAVTHDDRDRAHDDLHDEVARRGSLTTGRTSRETIGGWRLVVVHRVCSWCRREFAREHWLRPNDDEVTTWGICTHCIGLREGRDDAIRK